jgi:hypothetical protein
MGLFWLQSTVYKDAQYLIQYTANQNFQSSPLGFAYCTMENTHVTEKDACCYRGCLCLILHIEGKSIYILDQSNKAASYH